MSASNQSLRFIEFETELKFYNLEAWILHDFRILRLINRLKSPFQDFRSKNWFFHQVNISVHLSLLISVNLCDFMIIYYNTCTVTSSRIP